MNKQPQKKISLARETVQRLERQELSSVVGAMTYTPGCITYWCSRPLTCTDKYC
ncbi:MAG TPA: hypothetical protein VKY89_08300 [Thermoanaerobaculia bacterium]|nr:hypothetical protein [Thermoanaerobaculia bacterium]